jgi:uncharacterized membrane protein YjgN (DUF898 family)
MADLTWPIISIGIMTTIALIGIFTAWKIIKDKKSGFPSADERTQKINGKAAFYALLIGQYFIIALLFMLIIGREFFGMPEPDAGYPLIASLLVFSLTFLGLRWHFNRKGELQ